MRRIRSHFEGTGGRGRVGGGPGQGGKLVAGMISVFDVSKISVEKSCDDKRVDKSLEW